jgi:pimeloyl-ACP methyl ester carboxylesterase
MIQRFTAPDGLSLAYIDEPGQGGLPILCLPGLTRSHTDFEDLRGALAGRHRLVRFTFRGRGFSDRDPDPMNYAVPTEAVDTLALLDHLGIARALVVGTSRGGLVAMMIAAMAPQRLAGVLLNDIGPEIAPEGLARIMTYLGVPPRARTYEEAAGALEATMGAGFPGLPPEKWLDCARRWFGQGPDGLVLTYDPALRVPFDAAMAAPAVDLWPLFDALAGIPVAVLRGANSDLLTPETVAAMQARRPDLIAAEVPDRGHVPFLDEPEALAALDALIARAAA